ncbi:hypothetical protein [Marinicrinis sediminis]|uniref:Uncharacterized protein n=1 Tax=Marinicrinis sediminis TaxID=1652465 RepID=A0ABW5RG67_9BACL
MNVQPIIKKNVEPVIKVVHERREVMSLGNCKACGKVILLERDRRERCADCEKAQQIEFRKIKDYLLEHPQTTLMELQSNPEMSLHMIQAFMREQELEHTRTESR